MKKRILFHCFLIWGCIFICSCSSNNYYSIKSIVNGNTIELVNGYNVVLLGVEDSPQGKEFLKRRLDRVKIRLKFDRCSPKKLMRYYDKIAYAYVITQGKCINTEMLRDKIVSLEEHTYLQDSLSAYRTYAGVNPENIKPERTIVVNPSMPITEPNDIDLSQWTYQSDNTRNDLYLTDDCEWNCKVLQYVCDFNSSITRDLAVQLAKKVEGEYSIYQVCEIYKYLRTRWKYVNDPRGSEYLAKASESIAGTKLGGDCDDFAILMYSTISAIGGKARINFAYNHSNNSGHAYTEVFLADFNETTLREDIQSRFPDYNVTDLKTSKGVFGTWLNLDWTAAYPGGPYFEADEKMKYFFDVGKGCWICE